MEYFKIIQYVFIILLFTTFFNCGIEDTIYYQEPRLIQIEGTESNVEVFFYGYNQEKDDDKFLFVGYDIYYYFNDPKTAKKAQVKNPLYTINRTGETPLISFTDPARLPSALSNDMYRSVSFPVTIPMIENILIENNNKNVKFTFHKLSQTLSTNPFIDGNTIVMEQLFPNYNDYNNLTWGTLDLNFIGFYDADYYNYYQIADDKESPSPELYKFYDINIYIVAKGFNSNVDRTLNLTQSIPSSTSRIKLRVDMSTLTK